MQKLRRTFEYALSVPTLSVEIKRALSELLSPENLAISAGVMVTWAAAHFFGVGEVVDAILVGTAYVTLGFQGIQGLADLVEFGYDVINAKNDFDLRRAAEKLARAFVLLGAEVVQALLTRKAKIKPSGAKDAPHSRGRRSRSDVPPRTSEPPKQTLAPVKPTRAELAKPKPNTTYSVNGYTYKTDAQGRVLEVSGPLKVQKSSRNVAAQREVGKSVNATGDEGGHLIGSRFGGSGEKINMVPQDANLNRSAWKKMENTWHKALKEGKSVEVKVRPVYSDGSPRPTSFSVTQIIDGKKEIRLFENKPGG